MKKDYMTRLERWARWMLPPREADDVLADYREIAGTPPRPDEELIRDLGKPRKVIRPLVQKKPYCTWLAVFALMAACILIPANSPVPLLLPDSSYVLWNSLFSPHIYLFIPGFHLYLWFMIPGLVLSLVWFRPRKGEPKAPLPRSLIVTLIAELALMGGVWWCLYQLSLHPGGILFQPALITHWFDALNGRTTLHVGWMGEALQWGGIAVGVVGVAALVKARTQNRRWRAVYVMSFALMMLAFCLLNLYFSMDPASRPWPFIQQCCTTITIIGILGTGVALC